MRTGTSHDDTICAIATPLGESAIGIVRISGPEAFSLSQSLFKGRGKLSEFDSHTAHRGELFDPFEKRAVDEALFLVMKKPHSYTGEDVVEIQSHGNPFVLQKIISLLLAQGARLAMPGEFTRRAFLSGRLDLAQAEAVMEIITSQNERSHQWALGQLKGHLSDQITRLREGLRALLAQIEASIDFSEEGLTFCSSAELQEQIRSILQEIKLLLASYEEGRQIRNGFVTVIVGRPNVGKSSLMNLLLKEERAIVTPFPGTTRDILQEWTNIEGISLKLTDTAGFRQTLDPIEAEGVRRGYEVLKGGDLALWVLDASAPLQEEDIQLAENLTDRKKIVILNKADLPRKIDLSLIARTLQQTPVLSLSAATGEGLPALKTEIVQRIVPLSGGERPLVALARHRNALMQSEKSLHNAVSSLEKNLSWEFAASDLREGAEALGDIIGDTTPDAILDEIFNRFCIGK